MSLSSTYDSTVNSFYLAFYGRPADPAGLKFWSQQLAGNNGDLGAITQFFAASEEAQVRFGTDSVAERIAEIYQSLFNRAPEAAGLAFWTNAVEQGHASLADVSISILKGAQGSDAALSTLRQQAADDFTAHVEAAGSQYDGYAAIEAARILVRAVTANASPDDLAELVNAAVSFADTATKNPKVVDAIAVNTTLLALFDTARGTQEPVALAKALADTAKAAAGDPVTLESLLRGGGMDKVLKVMPVKATLADVVAALAKGGLPAAVEVVYPSTPAPTPVTAMEIKFLSVSQGPDDQNLDDNITNVKFADVKFKYTGKDLVNGQHFEYSIDGQTWFTVNPKDVDAQANTVTLAEVNLTGFTQLMRGAPAEVSTTVVLRAVDGNKVIASAEQAIVYDATEPQGVLSFYNINDGDKGVNTTSAETATLAFGLDEAYDDASVQWRIAGEESWTLLGKPGNNSVFTLADIDLSKADVTIEMRLIDAAGNVGHAITQFIDGPAGAVVTPTFSLMPSLDGLMVGANVAGELQLVDGKEVTTLKASSEASQNGFTVYTIGAQDHAATGTLQFKPTNGAALASNFVEIFTLGTDKGDQSLSGRAVWGFDGDDTITGTSEQDFLIGGAGNDTIHAGAGADQVYGGLGADLIDLGEDEDADQVYYTLGDAAGAVFVDGGSTATMDKISSFGTGDRIVVDRLFMGLSSVQSTYLSDGGSLAWAVVRGSDAGGVFVAGSGQADDDYMVQWGDGEQVNSVIVHDYGTTAPLARIDGNSNSIGFEQPFTAKYSSTNVTLSGNPQTAVIVSTDGPTMTMAKSDGVSLVDFGTGSDVALGGTINPVTMNNTVLYFNQNLKPGLYKMSWESGTFTTTHGVMEGAQVLFAGGSDGQFFYRGFELDSHVMVHGATQSADDVRVNQAFISDGKADASIETGGGNDVIVDNGSKLTIVYSVFDERAHDLILGFDKGDDVISLKDEAATLLDKTNKGQLDWVDASLGNIVATTEGVHVTVKNMMPFGPGTDLGTAAGTLESVLDVSAIAQDDYLLILADANVGNAGALLLYRNIDGNGHIDGHELTTIAVFGDGVASPDDIVLVGSQLPD